MDSLPPLQVIWFLLNKSLDAKSQKARTTRVMRSGTSIGKSVGLPPTPARHVALFAHNYGISHVDLEERQAGAIARFVLEQKGQGPERDWPRRQLEFYDHALEMYPFRLVDTFLVIHNLQSNRSRRLRCEWYEEQLFWSHEDDRNRDLEDLSLAFVLAKWRKQQRLIPLDDTWGERIVDPTKGDVVDPDPYGPSPSQYFVKLHNPMKARKRYQR